MVQLARFITFCLQLRNWSKEDIMSPVVGSNYAIALGLIYILCQRWKVQVTDWVITRAGKDTHHMAACHVHRLQKWEVIVNVVHSIHLQNIFQYDTYQRIKDQHSFNFVHLPRWYQGSKDTVVSTENLHDLARSVISVEQALQPLCYLSFNLAWLDAIQQVHLDGEIKCKIMATIPFHSCEGPDSVGMS